MLVVSTCIVSPLSFLGEFLSGTLTTVPSNIFNIPCWTPSPKQTLVKSQSFPTDSRFFTSDVPELVYTGHGTNLVDLVQEHDTYLRPLDAVAGVLEELTDDAFYVLADVAGLRERRAVADRERNV